MMNELSLPGRCEEVAARRVLVLAPHFDDEILGCGGLLLALREQGAAVHLLFLSDGGAGVEGAERVAYSERRLGEARQVAARLGASLETLVFYDGALDQHLDALANEVQRVLLGWQPDLVLLPSPLEVSRDHRATFAAVHHMLATARGEGFEALEPLRFFTYEVNFPQYPDLLFDVTGRIEELAALMALYPSQQERHDYWGARQGLLQFRRITLPPTVVAAEAYRRLSAEDFRLRGLAAMIAWLGGRPELLEVHEGPRISVVVRTKDRPEFLAEALESLAASTWRRLEVVLVNDGGQTPQVPVDFPFELRRVELQPGRGRAGAANAGIAAATGQYLCFLDDDDLVEPEHFEILAGLVAAQGVRVAYSDAAVGVYVAGGAAGWQASERRLPYSRDFDPDLLLFDNYIPFHTLIFERELALAVGPLDEGLPFFEDWEFLIRLAAKTSFHHLARVTCEYRHFRGAGHHILGDRPRQATDFLAMRARVLEKHADKVNPARTVKVIDQLRAEKIGAEEAGRGARTSASELAGRLHAVETHNLVLQDALERARLREDAARVHHDELHRELAAEQVAHAENRQRLDRELTAAYAEIARLEELRRAMESSRAWRVHQFLSRFKPGSP